MKHLLSNIRAFIKDERAIATIEFVGALPFLLTMLAGAVEMSHLVYAGQKSQLSANNIANLILLQDNITSDQLRAMGEMLPRIARPIDLSSGEYSLIVTAMQRDANPADLSEDYAYIRWQKQIGTAGDGSAFAYTNAGMDTKSRANEVTPSELNGFTFAEGEQVIVVEVYMLYKPILITNSDLGSVIGLSGHYTYHRSPPMRPRAGSFQHYPDDSV